MKGFFYLLVVTIAVRVTITDAKNDLFECKTELGIEGNIDEKSDKWNCLYACLYRKKGFLKNEKIDVDSIVEKFRNKITDEKLDNLRECLEQANRAPDECEVARLTRGCVMPILQELIRKFNDDD